MKDYQGTSAIKRARIAVIIAAAFLVIALVVFAIAYSLSGVGNEPQSLTKEDIAAKIDSVRGGESEYNYAATYLLDFGIRGFDASKFKTAESFFHGYSIYEMKPTLELAIETAELFLEFYYDTVDLADKTELTDALITCYVEATGDKYAVYRTREEYENYNADMSGSFVGIGVYVRYSKDDGTLQVTSVMEESAALEAGILAGDYLIAVDGKILEDIGYESFISSIRGEVGTSVTVTVLRGDEHLELTATRKQITTKTVSYSIDEEKIGYLQLTGFKENTAEQFCEAIDALEASGAVGIVFDLRDNPGGYLTSVIEVIDYLVPKGTRIASYTSVSGETVYTAQSNHCISVPITVVFNENTASAGELFSAAMRDYSELGVLECRTVGKNTYSKGVMQNTGTFADGSTLTLTIAYYNPPCNINYDGIGVAPDVVAEWGADGDPQLAAAYEEIKSLINKQSK